MTSETSEALAATSWLTRAGWLFLGFSLGGFFDGIVLHQILQWHHLLSGLDGPEAADIRFQILADGLFHLLMYLVALTGAVLLVAARASGKRGGTSSEILKLVLIGFGIWHVVDAVLSHWLLGLHRIKMDSDMPLFWDLTWLAIFGIAPLLLAAFLPNRGGPSRGAAAAMMSVVLATGFMSAAAPRYADVDETIVVFRAGMPPPAIMEAIGAANARLKWNDASGTVWGIDGVSWSGLLTLHAHGALIASSTPILAGCLSSTRPPPPIPVSASRSGVREERSTAGEHVGNEHGGSSLPRHA